MMAFRRSARSLPVPPAGRLEITIEAMRRRHVREVVAIEEQIFPRPWSRTLYLSELSMPGSRLYYVALHEGAVVGYAGAMLVAGEGHVTTVGVAPEFQRHGIGRRVFFHLVSNARAAGAKALTLEVRVSNKGAQQLYQSFGFAPAGIRKNYYAEVNEDGLVMWAHEVDTPAYEERLAGIAAQIEARSGDLDG